MTKYNVCILYDGNRTSSLNDRMYVVLEAMRKCTPKIIICNFDYTKVTNNKVNNIVKISVL